METYLVCCNKHFLSSSTLHIHKKEKHTYNNTIIINCKGCLKDFYSVIFTKNKKQFSIKKCEECRDLQKKLSTNDIIHNTYIYDNNKQRFFIDKGKAIQVCSIYTCQESFPCKYHLNECIVQCNGSKCNNCYIKNELNQCNKCIERSHTSKNKFRQKLKMFKEDLGGKCVDCGFDELFFLEFDHIDPSKKTIQITRSSPEKWENERNNLELRCGRCHRIKNELFYDQYKNNKLLNKNQICKLDKKSFVKLIKRKIGQCQLCNWTINDKDKMCCALDFDHIIDNKRNQISNLYNLKKQSIIEEILKTRLICRHCHELYTCLQRGGKALKFYYSEEQIEYFKQKLYDITLIQKSRAEIINILNSIFEL